jgi:hypothetical protein
MKFYQAITILILISYVFTDTSYCDNGKPTSPSKAEDCNSHKTNGGYCCLVKSSKENKCSGLGPNEYKAIKEMVKLYKKCNYDIGDDCGEDKDYSIDCKSSYLVLSLLSLIILFL